MTGDGSGTRAGGQALLFGRPAQLVCGRVCTTFERPESSVSSRSRTRLRRRVAFSTTVTADLMQIQGFQCSSSCSVSDHQMWLLNLGVSSVAGVNMKSRSVPISIHLDSRDDVLGRDSQPSLVILSRCPLAANVTVFPFSLSHSHHCSCSPEKHQIPGLGQNSWFDEAP
ncbi:hypothetical protein BKA81DRAFT_193966 [Phyllosticta paracitricarpa]